MGTRSLLLLLAATLAAAPDALPCGDKFLVIGRGPRRIQKAAHPAAVLLYMKAGSQLPSAARDLKLQASLQQAGHTVSVAADAAQLQEMMGSGRYDVVLADLSEARAIRAASPGVAVVPVAYRATPDELASGRRDFERVVEAPQKGLAFLDVVAEAARASRSR